MLWRLFSYRQIGRHMYSITAHSQNTSRQFFGHKSTHASSMKPTPGTLRFELLSRHTLPALITGALIFNVPLCVMRFQAAQFSTSYDFRRSVREPPLGRFGVSSVGTNPTGSHARHSRHSSCSPSRGSSEPSSICRLPNGRSSRMNSN